MFMKVAAVMGLAFLLASCAEIRRPVSSLGSDGGDDERGSARAWHSWTGPREIPDGDHQGILLGPVYVEGGGKELGTLVLRLDITHPATVDLDIWLSYDADGDGRPDVRGPVEFFRMRTALEAEELHACLSSLNGTYYFRDDSGDEDAAFTAFRTFQPGHAFYLAVADTLAEITGSILGWSVCLDEPTARAK